MAELETPYQAPLLPCVTDVGSIGKVVSVQSYEIDYRQPIEKIIPTLPPLLTISQIVTMGVCSDREVRKMCADGQVKAIKVGKNWRIYRDSLLRHIGLIH